MLKTSSGILKNSALASLWNRLTPVQKRYCVVMQHAASKKAAAEEIGIPVGTVYHWPSYVDDAVQLLQDHAVEAAMAELQGALVEAAMVKTREIREPGTTGKAQQDAATEIIDRIVGKPTQRQEVQHEGGLQVESESLASVMEALKKRAGKLD